MSSADANAMFYSIAMDLWSGEYNDEIAAFSDYYNTFMTDYYEPYIEVYLIIPYGEYVFVSLIGAAATLNLFYTFLTDSGANNIAVVVTMLKAVLADQPLPGGRTLYGVFDWIIEKTAKAPPSERPCDPETEECEELEAEPEPENADTPEESG